MVGDTIGQAGEGLGHQRAPRSSSWHTTPEASDGISNYDVVRIKQNQAQVEYQ